MNFFSENSSAHFRAIFRPLINANNVDRPNISSMERGELSNHVNAAPTVVTAASEQKLATIEEDPPPIARNVNFNLNQLLFF